MDKNVRAPIRVREWEMQLKLFILPVKNLSAAEGEMNGFLRAHRVLAVKQEESAGVTQHPEPGYTEGA